MKKHVFQIAITGIALAALPATSFASSWNFASQKAPLMTQNSHGQGWGSASVIDTSNGTRDQTTGLTFDRQPGNESIYWEAVTQGTAGSCFSTDYTSCTADFFNDGTAQGTRFSVGAWRKSTNSSPTPTDAKATRVIFRVCEDIRYRPDNCSGFSVPRTVVKLG